MSCTRPTSGLTAPGVSVDVSVTTAASTALPGQTVMATVTAFASGGAVVDSVDVASSGVLTTAQSVPVGVAGAFTTTQKFTIPATVRTGLLTITATAHAGSATGRGQTQVVVADTAHPALQMTTAPAAGSIVEPGDTVRVSLTASDAVAVAYTTVKATGAFTRSDSVNAGTVASVQRTVTWVVPAAATLNSAVQITGMVANDAGLTTMKTASLMVADTAHPVVSGTLTATHGVNGAAPGDVITITVKASDRRKLAYLGYALGAPASRADSVATSASSYTLAAQITVPTQWSGTSTVTVFARDSVGNRTSVSLGTLVVRTQRAMLTVSLPAAVYDAAFDPARNVAYLSMPSREQVAVLSITNGAFGTPYTFTAPPRGVDLTAGGDSLVVGLLATPANLGIINLVGGATTMLPVPVLSPDSIFAGGLDHVRVARTNVALVTTTFAGSGYGGNLEEVNLATGVTTYLQVVTEGAPLAVTGNRQRIVVLIGDSCCPETALLYDATSNAIVVDVGTVQDYANWVSADLTGATYLIGNSVLNSSLQIATAYSGVSSAGVPTAIASDGKSGYFPTATGVVQVRLSDMTTLATYSLGETPQGMWVSPDGLTLFVAGTAHGFVIDLW